MSVIYRTATSKDFTDGAIGREVRLAGWVETVRDHGGVCFVDLRDGFGVVQVVFRNSSLADGLRKEDCVSLQGVIEKRDKQTYNPSIPTGTVELSCTQVTVLNAVRARLPFEVSSSHTTREDLRLKYRFLDLRNPVTKDKIILRAKLLAHLRAAMEEEGFLEVQTPVLCASSPEGARDFIVPSRRFKGRFYALPQAPQQYKQLLMASGVDKYFQIAPCFRDEDARADRAAGEFYQLDMEMAFADEQDVFEVTQKVMRGAFEKFAPAGSKITALPFPVIPYGRAMLEYGSDKPDLRNPLKIVDLTNFFAKCTFKPFHGKCVRAIKVRGEMSKGFHEKMLAFATSLGMPGLGYLEVSQDKTFKGPIDKFIPQELKGELLRLVNLSAGDTVFFIADVKKRAELLAGKIRDELGERLNLIDKTAFAFCFINDFPMYEYDDESGALAFTHNPFSMIKGGEEALKTQDATQITAYQYDLVCNGVELASGAVRNCDPDLMLKIFAVAGYTEDDVKEKFGALYTAFNYGAPPHAGIAPGFDRTLMLLCGADSIREVAAFPMSANGQDVLFGAPNTVEEARLREVHIKIRQ